MKRLYQIKKTQKSHLCRGCGAIIKKASSALALKESCEIEGDANFWNTLIYFCNIECYNEFECRQLAEVGDEEM